MLNEGRKHDCVDQIEICIRQIANLENEIRVLEEHDMNKKLKEKMEYVQYRLKKHVLAKKKQNGGNDAPIGSSLR